MKITNFFIDFIVIGVIAGACVLLPVYMFNHSLMDTIINNTKDRIFITPILTVVVYIIGIIFNQISDQVIKKMLFLPILKDIRLERSTFKKIGITDHDCVQRIVYKSPSAYEYLSYRRSIIRIIKSLIMFSTITLIVHPLSALIGMIYVDMIWSFENTAILVSLIFLFLTMVITLRKVEVGYFKAIKSFYGIIQAESKVNIKIDN